MGTVTVLVAGPDDPAVDVGEVLHSWGEAGLLRPCLWVRRDRDRGGGAGELVALRLQKGRYADVPLLDELARLDVDSVRLVSVHLAVEVGGDPELTSDTESIAASLEGFLSRAQELDRLNLVVPTTGVSGLDPSIVHHPGVKHVVVSPEDRQSDRRASRHVDWPDGGYAGHAALAIATVTGLWWATETAPFDRSTFTASAERPRIVVTRSFARVLHAPGLGDRLTAEVFERRRTEAWTAAAVGAVAAPNPTQTIEDLATELGGVENGALNYTPSPGLPAPREQSVGIFRAFTMMLRFIVGKLRAAPSQLADRVAAGVRRSVENFAQNVVFGQDSVMRVGSGGRRGPATSDQAPGMLAADYAAKLLRDMGANTSPPAVAGLWEALRRVSFGVIDAGPFPEGVTVPQDGARRLVVNEVGHVVAEPADHFQLDGSRLGASYVLPAWATEPISPWDSTRLRELRELLIDEHELAQHGRVEEDLGDGSYAPAVEPDPELAERLGSLLLDVDAFVASHESSLLWRVSTRLDSALRRASHSFLQALATVRRGERALDDSKMRLAARWLRRRWILWFLLALAVPAIAWYGEDQRFWEPEWWAVIAASLLVWLIGWFVSFISYQRRVFRIQYEIDRHHRDHLAAIVRAEHDAKETVRLTALYEQFLDWAAIIAWMVHHPEGRIPQRVGASLQKPAEQPLAMSVAEGIPSEETLQRTSAIVGRDVFSRGWLGTLYRSYSAASIAALKHRLGLPEEAADPDPDRDLADPPPRRFIRDQLVTGVHASAWHERVRNQVDSSLTALGPDELFSHIDSGRPDDAHGRASDFLAGALPDHGAGGMHLLQQVWRHETLFSEPHEVDAVTLWAPVGLARGLDPHTVVRDSAPADEAIGGAFVLAVVRCDASEGSTVDQLAVFEPAPEPALYVPHETENPDIG